ncbi:His Kinase A (phospho-acceptor) domain-containing protein [bacterium A37T11]|nr:His Kinase A (phospho-acceptor) domain-containing protein [bacterium A37T11]
MRKTLFLFYFLIFYALAQVVWWGMLLVHMQPTRKPMIIGEGIFFMLIFLVGALLMRRAFINEHKVQRQQNNFLLSVTHELKSPLASIKLYIQTILKRKLDKEQQIQFLSNSLKDIERLDDLVENVLIATKLEKVGAKRFTKELFDFSELVERISDRLQIHSCTSQVLITQVEPNISIIADRMALTSVVTNLIENAIKYSPPCANVQVELKRVNGAIILVVADHGIGINEYEKKYIFDKFYRVGSEETRKTKGTGLGLYIVKNVLDHHQAQIKVKDNVPSGTVFEVIFNN